MRLFVALDLPEGVRGALRELVERLQRTAADVRWVRPEGMHLTVKFMGEVPEGKLSAIKEALVRVTCSAPVEVAFRGLGYFPNARQPRVFWVGVEASENLAELAAQVEAGLEPLGIAREKRRFKPHLTLGRFKSTNRLAGLQKEIASLPSTEFGHWVAHEFFLYQSKLLPRGAQYTQLERFPFGRN